MSDFTLPIHDPVLIFAVVMLVVLIAPLLFARLRVPGLVGLILCGALIGPSGLGLLERDATIILLGTVGLLYLMFVAGLALDLNQFHRQRSRSLVFGAFSFFVPQVMGIVVAIYLLGYSLAPALLLGSIVGSHTLLAYPIASRLGITKNTAVIMTMGGTIVTDMLALLLLAVVVGAADGALDLWFWIRFLGLITLYLAAVLMGLPRLGRWFLRSTRGDANLAFVFLVTALFVTAYLAGVAGLAPIIGAFLAGIVLNRLVPEIGPLMSRVKFVGETLFIPFFLLSVGMLVDFSVLVSSLAVWYAALVFTALVLVGKGVAAGVVTLLYRYTRAEGWTIFGLSVPQAAATLAVTLVGFDLGLFDQTAVNAVVVMILLTCLLGPSLVERYGRQVNLQEQARPYRPSEAPQRILIPLSNPSTSDTLVDVALAIRRDDSDEPVFPLAVVRDGVDVAGQVAAGERLLSEAVMRTVSADVPVTPMTRVDIEVARGIMRAITESRISHIVIGWGGTASPRQRIFGTILDRLLDLSLTTVLVCRITHPINTMQRIVLTVPPLAEREPGFDEALRTVKLLASRIGADLILATPEHTFPVVEAHVQAAKPDLPLAFLPLGTDYHHRLLTTLAGTLADEDLVVLLSARESQPSWQPALDRLPRLFADRFPKNDFIILYPPISEPERMETTGLPTGPASRATLPAVEVVDDLEAASPMTALHALLHAAYAEQPQTLRDIVSLLLDESDLNRQVLSPGVVLFHAHTALVSRQRLFMGISREGMRFEPLADTVEVMLVLLNPQDLSPEAHLRTLAHLARSLRRAYDPEIVNEGALPDSLLQALKTHA